MFTDTDRQKAITVFLADIDKVGEELNKRLARLVQTKSIGDVELSQIVAELDFFKEMRSLGFEKAVNKYIGAYEDTVTELIADARKRGVNVSAITAKELDTLADIDTAYILRRAEMYGVQMKSEIAKSLISGVPRSDMVKTVLPAIQAEMKFNTGWFTAAINQSYTQFANTATAKVFKDTEELFVLNHIFDVDTRPLCRHAMENMLKYPKGLTIEEINSGKLYEGYKKKYPSEPDNYDFINLGDFNCRGFWEFAE
jgi:hypothetical protein